MAGIKNYGDLNDKELIEFLTEIKSDDEDIDEAKIDSDKKIDDEEMQSMLSELPENAEIEAFYGEDAWRKLQIGQNNRSATLLSPYSKQKAAENRKKAFQKKAQRLKEDRLFIQREAFNQDFIKLSDRIENEYIKLLISILVQEHTRMVDKYSDYINKRIASLLNPFIPRRLRLCKIFYPNSVKACPGFMYKASEEYGGGLTFWTTPKIAYYFEQGTEQEILLKNKLSLLYPIDKAVSFYHEHLKKRQKKELKYASLIIQKKVCTYFDLLKLNPFWFKALFNELKNKQNGHTSSTT